MPLGPIISQMTLTPKCCGCCCSYGNIEVTLNCNKNFVTSGDTIFVSGSIDLRNGKTDVTDANLTFCEKRIMIADSGDV